MPSDVTLAATPLQLWRSIRQCEHLPRQPFSGSGARLVMSLQRGEYLRKLEKAVAVRNSLLESFPANFDAAGKSFPDFPTARNAIPAKVSAFSGKENGCWKIGPASGNAAGFSPPRPPRPSWVLLSISNLVHPELLITLALTTRTGGHLYRKGIPQKESKFGQTLTQRQRFHVQVGNQF